MADRYLQEIRQVQPSGPYDLVGQCIGGLVSLEMSRRLREQGQAVSSVVMYDPPNVYSRHFRIFGPLPGPGPSPTLQSLANRLMGTVSNVARWVVGKRARASFVRVRVLAALGRRVASLHDREQYGEMAMLRAAWRYRPRPTDVPTVLIHTGMRNATKVAMAGQWTDGMMGWSDFGAPDFRAHHVASGHNSLPYQEESVRVLLATLDGEQG